MGSQEESRVRLVTFSCKEAYVYIAPPATTVGHRAELWNVDSPLQEVACSVVTSGDDCCVRLFDKETGDLYAECPIMKGKPLTSSVEPVVDSSRYYVLRVVDIESQRHAFIGFGFRERSHSSNFTAALSEYQQYLRRSEEAASMQKAFAAAESGQGGPDLPNLDFSLKPGETVSLRLNARAPTPEKSFLSERLAAMSVSGADAPSAQAVDSSNSEKGGPPPLLPPPPQLHNSRGSSVNTSSSNGSGIVQDARSEGFSSADENSQHAEASGTQSRKHGRHTSHNQEQVSRDSGHAQAAEAAPENEEDEFGTFVG